MQIVLWQLVMVLWHLIMGLWQLITVLRHLVLRKACTQALHRQIQAFFRTKAHWTSVLQTQELELRLPESSRYRNSYHNYIMSKMYFLCQYKCISLLDTSMKDRERGWRRYLCNKLTTETRSTHTFGYLLRETECLWAWPESCDVNVG